MRNIVDMIYLVLKELARNFVDLPVLDNIMTYPEYSGSLV